MPPRPADSKWVQFYEAPGLLLIRLMSRCNEKCVFCMVADEIEFSDDVDYEQAVRRIKAQPPGTRIEFFGGEPTIYPRFLDLLRLARERGHPCSIASNVRAFHSDKFTMAIADMDASKIYIRTSLYGDDEQLHDYYTATPGSFRQTSKGVQNIVRAGFRSQVNLVILRQNYERLNAMTELVHSWRVPRIKFGNLIAISTCEAHAVQLSLVRPHLQEAVSLAERLGLIVTIEKTPICVASGRIDLISTERAIGNWSRVFDDTGECKGCLVRPWCDGLDPDYVTKFGYDGLERIESVSKRVLKGTAHDSLEPEFLKTHCVAIDDFPPDSRALAALNDLLAQVEAKHGSLAVFPQKYVRAEKSLNREQVAKF